MANKPPFPFHQFTEEELRQMSPEERMTYCDLLLVAAEQNALRPGGPKNISTAIMQRTAPAEHTSGVSK